MTEYTFFFEIYGKKMQAKITAVNQELAKEQLLKKIIIRKVTTEPIKQFANEESSKFMDFFGDMIKGGDK